MDISVSHYNVCSRDYSDFTVLYDLRNQQILKLESVSADIWNYIYENELVSLESIINHITSIYECNPDDIRDDITDFVNELYFSGVIMLNNTYHSDISPIGVLTNNDDTDVEGQIINELIDRDQLYSATIEMTYSCNEKCIHCYAHYPNSIENSKLTAKTYTSFIDQLYESGVMHIAFTGGDPFMNPLFPEIFKYSRNRGFVCDIFTNGICLAQDEDLLNDIADMKPRAFFISLYGSTAEVHDSITQIPGSFDKTIKTIKSLKSKGIGIVLNIMILKNNYSDYQNIIEFANNLDVEYRTSMSLIYRNDRNASPMEYFIGDKNKAKSVIKSLNKMYSIDKPITYTNNSSSNYICGAGVSSICLSPDGTVYPCVSLKIPLGNVLTDRFEDIWTGNARKDLLSKMTWENTKKCTSCQYQNTCPHCAAMSQAENNDYLECNTCDRFIAECIYEIQSEQKPNRV